MSNECPRLSPSKTVLRGSVHSSIEPTDRLGLYVICFIGMVGVALVCRIQLAYSPSIWTHLITALPPVLLACLLPVRLLRGWLTRSRSPSEAEAKQIEPPANSSGVIKQAAA